VDRVKDVINTGGIQVSGSEVEEVLFDHEAVSDVAVIGLPDEKWIEAVSAVVVLKKDAETKNLREGLQEHAREKLADFKRPKHIFFVDDLPRNAAGKILKRGLREEFGIRN
jgi:fatty-acyl-CoA synthase